MVKIKEVRRKAKLEDALKDKEIMEEMAKNMTSGSKLSTTVATDLVEIHSENYMVIDTDVLAMVEKELSNSDYMKLFSLGVFLKTKFNILFNHTKPFTVETLSKKLDINIDNTNKFVKRMCQKGIMAYTVCAPSGYLEKIYAINPQLIRRGKQYDKEFLVTYFRVFDKSFKDGIEVDVEKVSALQPSKQFD